MKEDNELLKNLDKLHTTELGVERIKRNLSLDTNRNIFSYWTGSGTYQLSKKEHSNQYTVLAKV